MRNENKYEQNDNPIDWSFFEEAAVKDGPVEGSMQLRVVSVLMLVLGLVALIVGVNGLGAQIELLNSNPGVTFALVDPVLLAGAGLLTLVPACFGLQTASTAVSFVAPTVLGLVGVAFTVVMTGVELFMGLMGAGGSMIPWVIGIALSLVYLVFVVRVHKAANESGQAKNRPSKEELWDESAIWK